MKKYVIIGDGVAGLAAAESIRSIDKESKITIYSDEEVFGYNRPMLTKSISKELNPEAIAIKDKKWYEDNNIEIKLGEQVSSINDLDYDRLVLATGAKSFLPPTPGNDLDGVFTIRTHKDILDIQNKAKNAKSAVVIGGGVLGLEAADDLKRILDNVTILERSPGLMSRQVDEEGSAFLKESAEAVGINVMTKAPTTEIIGDDDGHVKGVLLESGDTVDADIVIFSTGVKANVSLAEEAGIETGRAIKVDKYCRTSKDGVYAVGDCAEYEGINYSIIPQAMEMGRVAGVNIAEDKLKEEYEGVAPFNLYNGFNIKIFAVGDNGKNPDLEYRVVKKEGQRLYYLGDKFVGAVVHNDLSKIQAIMEGYKTGKYEE